jgi:hypothetical protein
LGGSLRGLALVVLDEAGDVVAVELARFPGRGIEGGEGFGSVPEAAADELLALLARESPILL